MIHINQRGQQYTVFKLLQGALIAIIMLGIVYGVVQSLRHQIPASDPYFVSQELLSSAYASAGTGKHFTKQAILTEVSFTAASVKAKAGLPAYVDVGIVCAKPYCIEQSTRLPTEEAGRCMNHHDTCDAIGFLKGDRINVCVTCRSFDQCIIFYGEKACA